MGATTASATHKLAMAEVRKTFHISGRALEVLAGVDLRVDDGEFVSIVGPSGCGKSTLLNIVAGLEEADSGTILLEGRVVPDRLGLLGYMHQKDLLLPWRNVLDNVLLGLEIKEGGSQEGKRKARELLEAVGLKGFEKHYPFSLSGGMRQRVAFLRTLLADQQVILLDEPFGALDALTRAQMQEWLLQVWSTFKKTVVLITHDIDEAILLSDRVYVLTARPACVKTVQAIPIPRPRSYTIVTSEPFIQLKARLLDALREETVRQSEGVAV